jgi:RNA polymerase sigma-70 factor (ECF subfamily)
VTILSKLRAPSRTLLPVTTVPALPAAGSWDAGRSGERPVFERVFQEHAPFVWRAARRLGVRADDVEDVCQEVFMVVHRRLGTFEGRSSLRTWIYGVCVRVVAKYRRTLPPCQEPDPLERSEPSVPPHQLDDLERRRAIALLDVILDKLDGEKREVFVLYEIEGVSMAEVAEAVGCPVQTAYARLYAARRQFDAAVHRARVARGIP